MTADGGEEFCEALTEHRLGRTGVQIKLDKGFAEGVYCVYVEYDRLAERVGFEAARREAMQYGALLKEQLGRTAGYALGDTEDASRSGDKRRRRDLECTFLSFPLTMDDGHWHDTAMKQRFRLAVLRADQELDQIKARRDTQRHRGRQEAFRQRLSTMLDGDAYRQLDAETKEHLLAEVTALAFPPKGREL